MMHAEVYTSYGKHGNYEPPRLATLRRLHRVRYSGGGTVIGSGEYGHGYYGKEAAVRAFARDARRHYRKVEVTG